MRHVQRVTLRKKIKFLTCSGARVIASKCSLEQNNASEILTLFVSKTVKNASLTQPVNSVLQDMTSTTRILLVLKFLIFPIAILTVKITPKSVRNVNQVIP